MITIPTDDMELLAECEVDVFRASGNGGQNVNRRETAVRLTHVPSGVVITCQDERSQWANKRRAVQRLRLRLETLNRPRRPRVATSIPAGVHRKRLADKRHRARLKRERNSGYDD